MCGIAGLVIFDGHVPLDQLRKMISVIKHRGPDDFGEIIDGPVALGMRRLSIIDVDGGQQPYLNEDRTIRVVFNGEIYNFRELRTDLEKRGHQFRSDCDGEVISHLWEEHGVDFPRHLNGMFGIALHDARAERLLLVRDRLGIKPLYYASDSHRLVFGSEIKSILASGEVRRELDVDALGQFLAWEYVPGTSTLFRGINKLLPGELLDFDLRKRVERRQIWWDVPQPQMNGHAPRRSRREWVEAIDAKLKQCVQRQLVSDVPLGAFLSGGVDSSLIVAAMGDSRTFSIGFEDATYNELPHARRVADHLGAHHTDELIQPDAVELFEHLMNFMEDPIGDVSIFPTYLVSRLARKDVKVVLSGDGADELFGGYETYLAQQKAHFWSKIPASLRSGVIDRVVDRLPPSPKKKGLVNKVKRFVEGMQLDPALGHARWRLFADCKLQHRLFRKESHAQLATPVGKHIRQLTDHALDRDECDRALYVDVKSYLCDNILTKVDRMSMACSLETRVPYLDHELVELAFQVPSEHKVFANRSKILLKEVAAQYIPKDCVYRRKEGFSIPMKHWLKTTFRPIMEELLEPKRLDSEGILDGKVVSQLRQEHLANQKNHAHILWSLIVFQDWRTRWGA